MNTSVGLRQLTTWFAAVYMLYTAVQQFAAGMYYSTLGYLLIAITLATLTYKGKGVVKMLVHYGRPVLVVGAISLASGRFMLDVNSFTIAPSVTNVVELVSIADGDTITVIIDGTKERVRFVGIDAPEYNPKECFREEATQALRALLDGKVITLQSKQSEDRDVYGRLLRYVHVGDMDVGLELVKQGFAVSYKKYPHERLDQYELYQATAKLQQKGMWGSCSL